MSACVCVHECQSPLQPGRQPTHCGIWCIDSRAASAAFPLTDSMACLRLWMLSEVKATCFYLYLFFYAFLRGGDTKSIHNALTLSLSVDG